MAGLELLSDQGYRIDGRRAGELRKIQARMGVFAQADGSAYIEQGNTKALAVVYGPHEASKRPGAGSSRQWALIVSEVPQPAWRSSTHSPFSQLIILTSWREEASQATATLFACLRLLTTSVLLSLPRRFFLYWNINSQYRDSRCNCLPLLLCLSAVSRPAKHAHFTVWLVYESSAF